MNKVGTCYFCNEELSTEDLFWKTMKHKCGGVEEDYYQNVNLPDLIKRYSEELLLNIDSFRKYSISESIKLLEEQVKK